MSKRFLVILMVCVLGLVGIYFATSKKDEGNNANSSQTSASLSQNKLGNNSKKVSLVEYGDFQCPACASFHPIIKQVVEKYKEDIEFQFRNFPLSQIHPNARAASRAAEAAGKQNKYWEMHDLLYEQQDQWSSSQNAVPIFESYASELKLDIEKFKKDYASTEINSIINADFAEGQKLGVDSTPSFFLQGKKLNPAPTSVDEFSKVIDEAIKNSNQ